MLDAGVSMRAAGVRCPKCGNEDPKERVMGKKKFNLTKMLLWSVLTGGIGLFLPFLWFDKERLRYHCAGCGNTWGDARIGV